MVTLLSGMDFDWQLHTGFVNHSQGVVIAPACAGINFLIISYATVFFTFVGSLRGAWAKCSWLGVSLAAAYLVTLCANCIRIIISIYLFNAPIYGGWVTPARVHELAGTLIYVSFLVTVFLAMERIMRRRKHPAPLGQMIATPGSGHSASVARGVQIPFAWYALITIFVPLLNGAARRNGHQFAEHSALVTVTALFAFTVWISIAGLFKKRIDISNKTKEKGENV
jgi:exosortase K